MARKVIAQASQDPPESTSQADTVRSCLRKCRCPYHLSPCTPPESFSKAEGQGLVVTQTQAVPAHKSLGLLMYESRAGLLGLQVL